jgi:hypothetical protein
MASVCLFLTLVGVELLGRKTSISFVLEIIHPLHFKLFEPCGDYNHPPIIFKILIVDVA